jgi:hypothetical protein
MWLSGCNMQDIQPAKEEHGLCGRCLVQPLVLAQDDHIYQLDGHTSVLDSSLAGRDLDTPEDPHGCETTSVLSTDNQGPDPLPITELPAPPKSPSLAQRSLLAILLAHSRRSDNAVRPGSLSILFPFRLRSVGLPLLFDALSNRKRSRYNTASSATGLVYKFSAEQNRWHLPDGIGIIFSVARAILEHVVAGIRRLFQ